MSARVISFEEMSRAARAGRGEKLVVGVERLLQWAYAQELVHMARPQGVVAELGVRSLAPVCAQSQDLSSLGTFVDTSRNMGFEAPDDAYAIERAVSRLGEVVCELPQGCCGRGLVRGLVPEVEARFRVSQRSIVFECASRCERPDWVKRPMLGVERNRKGNLYGKTVRRERMLTMSGVVFVGDMPWDVARARLVYSAWVDALSMLARTLAGTLQRFEAAVDGIDRAPWTSAD